MPFTNRLRFDSREKGGLETVRQVVLAKLRWDAGWNQFPVDASVFDPFVECLGPYDQSRMLTLASEVFWELIIAGVIAPGHRGDLNLPWFHLTDYGRDVVEAERFLPHDPTGYLSDLSADIPTIDPTVLSYLTEGLQCFLRGTPIAATVMLGIAAERVFLLVCDALRAALADDGERRKFVKLMEQNAIKPKLDWVLRKTEQIGSQHSGLPDTLHITFVTVFDFIRQQRNELGHPRSTPPSVTREEAFVNLRVFPTYYKTAETYRAFLMNHTNQL